MIVLDFFRINFPYGIYKNNDGEWFAFNRDWMPLGTKTRTTVGLEEWKQKFSGVTYIGLTEKLLIELGGERIKRNEAGEIYCLTFYGDGSKPMDDSIHWTTYSNKIKKIAKLKIKIAKK